MKECFKTILLLPVMFLFCLIVGIMVFVAVPLWIVTGKDILSYPVVYVLDKISNFIFE